MNLKPAIGAALALILASCATPALLREADQLTIARQGCFGFCPVYSVQTLTPSSVRFDGVRHTATLGKVERIVPRAALERLRRDLEFFRPATDSSFACEQSVSDQSVYTIRWSRAGTRNITLSFDSGCATVDGRRLKALLEAVPSRLGLADDARQVSRPGVSRG